MPPTSLQRTAQCLKLADEHVVVSSIPWALKWGGRLRKEGYGTHPPLRPVSPSFEDGQAPTAAVPVLPALLRMRSASPPCGRAGPGPCLGPSRL